MVQTHKLDLVHQHQFIRRFIELGENVLGQPAGSRREESARGEVALILAKGRMEVLLLKERLERSRFE